MIEGARQLPLAHISIRVPWNDLGWDGRVCQSPKGNNSCLVLSRVADTRDDGRETDDACKSWKDLGVERLPACAAERGAFMAPFAYTRSADHPYQVSGNDKYQHFKRTTYEHAPFSAACVPYAWMFKNAAEGDKEHMGRAELLDLGYRPELEPDKEFLGFETTWIQERRNQLVMLDTFFSAIRSDESLCFFYAKRTPLSEDSRRVLVGVGQVSAVGEAVEYKYHRGKERPIRCMLWERNVHHSIRPDQGDGFILPYQAVLEAAAEDGSLDPSEYVVHVPGEYFDQFSFGSEHVPHDGAIAVLLACDTALAKLGSVVPGDWSTPRQWINQQLNRLWTMRGPFPGLGSALTALGIERGTLVAFAIGELLAREGRQWNEDPWPFVERSLDDPALLGAAGQHIGKTALKLWKSLESDRRALLKLLSRFALTASQATRYYEPALRTKAGIEVKDEDLLRNPYLFFELDRSQLDRIQLGVIDRGLFADAIVREKHPVPQPSAVGEPIDERRVRAFVVDTLERAAEFGHSVQPQDWIIQSIRQRDVRPECPVTGDLIRLAENDFAPIVRAVDMGDAGTGYQLEDIGRSTDLIEKTVKDRVKGRRHLGSHPWRTIIDNQFGSLEEVPEADRAIEDGARAEKAVALRELFESRISVLVGPAGTGKTALLRALCNLPEVDTGGVLLLAPTGKARVRLETHAGRRGGQTIAQFLLPVGRYDPATGAYRVRPELEKVSDYKTVVIDESSMLTEHQLAAVLSAVKGMERLILVGDHKQLPPIGLGRPFYDVVHFLEPTGFDVPPIRVGAGYAELTVRRRQIGSGRADLLLADWFSGRTLDPGADEVWDRLSAGEASDHVALVRWDSPDELERELLERLVSELALAGPEDEDGFEQALGGTAFRDAVYFSAQWNDRLGAGAAAERWQILSPVRSHLHGVDAINRLVQDRFRQRVRRWAQPDKPWSRRTPKPFGTQGILYGDKVLNNKNTSRRETYPELEAAYVANGEIGVVVGQYKGRKWPFKRLPWRLEVEFAGQLGTVYRYLKWEFGEERQPPLELAYALTIHKAQGSEFGLTFVIIPASCPLLSSELLYTALTRQQDKVVVFHQGDIRELRRYGDPSRSELARRLTTLLGMPRPVAVQKQFLDDNLIHRTRRGELVRSKSELVIANLLDAMGLEYEYEKELVAPDGSHRYPDFTIDDADAGRTVFLEHLGMLADRRYRERWERKLEWYRAQGIYPTGQEAPDGDRILVTTEDDERSGLDSAKIEVVLKQALGRA